MAVVGSRVVGAHLALVAGVLGATVLTSDEHDLIARAARLPAPGRGLAI